MILTWMATATLFTFLLAVAALAGERALRTIGRQGRGPWLVALAAAVVWPIVAPLTDSLVVTPASDGGKATVPVVRSTIDMLASTLPPVPAPWFARADALVLTLWGIVSAALLVRLFLGWRALSIAARSASPGIIAGVPVLVTPAIGPAVFGIRRPRLLMPRWLLDLDAPQQTLALQHEREHGNARDPQLLLLCAIAIAIVPWNAGVWWIARRLRLAMELDCDARVLRVARDPGRYGKLLLFMAERQSHMRLASMLAESNSHLSRRISAMNASRPTKPMLRVALLTLIVTGVLACSAKYGNDLVTAPSSPGSATASTAQAASIPFYSPEGAKPVAQLPGSAAPRYPTSLRSAHVEGEVLVSFVVDTSGLVVPGSLRVMRSTDDLFAEAVRATASSMRFAPAELNGRKVRQLVQQIFFFDVAGSATSGTRKPVPTAVPTTDPANRNPMMLRPVVTTATP